MTLKINQTPLQLGKLYEVTANGFANNRSSLVDSIWVNSGSINLYGSDSATQPASLAEMTLNVEDTSLNGKQPIKTVCRYIALVQASGTSTEIVATSVNSLVITELGDIS